MDSYSRIYSGNCKTCRYLCSNLCRVLLGGEFGLIFFSFYIYFKLSFTRLSLIMDIFLPQLIRFRSFLKYLSRPLYKIAIVTKYEGFFPELFLTLRSSIYLIFKFSFLSLFPPSDAVFLALKGVFGFIICR